MNYLDINALKLLTSGFNNNNLIINSDFKVNQRGSIQYSCSGNPTPIYTIDRWRIRGCTTIDVLDSGMGINFSKTCEVNEGYGLFSTVIECPSFLIGKPLILSVKEWDSIYTIKLDAGWKDEELDVWKDIGPADARHTIHLKYLPTCKCIEIYFYIQYSYSARTINIKWVKLEVGQIVTSYIPPDPSYEIIRCMRYYQELTGIFVPYISGIYEESGTYNVVVSPKLPLRIYPNVKFKNNEFDTVSSLCISLYGYEIVPTLNRTISGQLWGNNVNNTTLVIITKKEDYNPDGFLVVANNAVCFDAEIYDY